MNTHEYMKHFVTKTFLEATLKHSTAWRILSVLALLHYQKFFTFIPGTVHAFARPIKYLWAKSTEPIETRIQEYITSHYPAFVEPYLKHGKPIPSNLLKKAVNMGPRDPKEVSPIIKEKLLEIYNYTATEGFSFPPQTDDVFQLLQFTSLAREMNWKDFALTPQEIETATQWGKHYTPLEFPMQTIDVPEEDDDDDAPEYTLPIDFTPEMRRQAHLDATRDNKEVHLHRLKGESITIGKRFTLDIDAVKQALEYAIAEADWGTKELIFNMTLYISERDPEVYRLLQQPAYQNPEINKEAHLHRLKW